MTASKLPLILALLFLGGCAERNPGSLPYKCWRLGFLAPDHMEVWVETADVEDIRGNLFYRMGGGTVSIAKPSDGSGNTAGWRSGLGWGAGRHVNGADLPRRIYVRWQSLAEPQTYRVILDIPERARQLMSERLDPPCPASEYREALALGLAPGGVVRGWVMSTCGGPIEVLRAQAEIEPKGPYEGTSQGAHRPLSETSRAYIEKHGIPYGSW
ncbi:hypothetical protein AUR59_014310 [Stutzerimonas balearica]|uniref:DUF2931 family protein n=1 Tax=Stutzerimonas balearica TaxID=74829 RepID=UPI0007733E75|nr:DUF2931 family protein [Stutzerimonas balearica]OMG64567.1 hypothetical protein AUR59_014310 [Stutzerimonas balearica]